MPESSLEVAKYQSARTGSDVKIDGRHFIDPHGRALDLRGANVSSSSKVCVSLKFTSFLSLWHPTSYYHIAERLPPVALS